MNATITRNCKEKDCKKSFITSIKEAKWLEDRGLGLFKRCPECRKKRRKEENGE